MKEERGGRGGGSYLKYKILQKVVEQNETEKKEEEIKI